MADLLAMRSDCKRYLIVPRIADTCFHTLYDATGRLLGDTTYWASHNTATHIRFATGFGEHRPMFSFKRYPRWFHRRWVEIGDCISHDSLAVLVEECKGTVVTSFKPSMCFWYHIGFRGNTAVRDAVDAEMERRGWKYEKRQPPGGWKINCPMSARESLYGVRIPGG